MTRYFFDFLSGDTTSRDEEGEEFRDVVAAHEAATALLAEAIPTCMVEGAGGQHVVIEVRDDLGRVLAVKAALKSRIFRRQ